MREGFTAEAQRHRGIVPPSLRGGEADEAFHLAAAAMPDRFAALAMTSPSKAVDIRLPCARSALNISSMFFSVPLRLCGFSFSRGA